MNPRYSALVQLVDYVGDGRHLAVGDLICVDGEWLPVVRVEYAPSHPFLYLPWVERQVGGLPAPVPVSVSVWPDRPVARIPGPLLELLHPEGHPYR